MKPAISSVSKQLSENPRTQWILYVLIVLALTVLFFADLRTHLLDTHDIETFRDNLAISEDFAYLFSPYKEHASGRLAYELAMWIFFLAWENDPSLFHVLVVVVHALASLSLALVVRRTGIDVTTSQLAGVLFLVNVAHFRVVHWISGLNYVLGLLWCLATFLSYTSRRRRASFIAFYFCLTAGFLSHPAAAAVVPLCLFWSLRQGDKARRALTRLVPGVVLLALLGVLSLSRTYDESSAWGAIGLYGVADSASLVAGIARMLLWLNARLVTTAHWLLAPTAEMQTWEVAFGALVLAGFLILAKSRSSAVAVWAAWTQIFLIPFILVNEEIILNLPSGPSRYLYFSSAGSAVVFAWILSKGIRLLSERAPHLVWPAAICTLGLVMFSSYIFMMRAEAISLYSSARSYAARGDAATSITLFNRAVKQGAGAIDRESAYERILHLELSQGSEVDSLLNHALQAYPKNLTFGVFRAVLNTMTADSTLRRQAQAEIDSLTANPPDGARVPTVVAQVYYNLGRGFSTRGRPIEAVAAHQKSLNYNRDELKTIKSLVLAISMAGDQDKASSMALRAAELKPNDPDAYYLTAYGLRGMGKLDEAIAACEDGIRKRPSFELYYLLGICYEDKSHTERALSAYERCLALRPTNPVVLERIAHVEYRRGEIGKATAALVRAIEAGARDVRTHLALSKLYIDKGEQPKGLEIYRRIVSEEYVGANSNTYTEIGIQLFEWGRLDEAMLAYKRAIAEDDTNIEARTNIGWIHYVQNRFDDAIQVYQKVLDREPQSVAGYNLGLAYLAREDFEEAKEAYAKAVSLYGADEARRIGAVDDLRILIDSNVGVPAGNDIMDAYWPEN